MRNQESILAEEIKSAALYRMDESSRMIAIALKDLSDAKIWERPNGISNSIGNQLLHLCGNITQYAISSLGETLDTRDRDAEFTTVNGLSKAELLAKLEATVSKAKEVIENCSMDNLIRLRKVQGFELTGIGIIMHVVEHYSYHTGQIAFWVKQAKNKPLGFYEGTDLNNKNDL
ncbi:DinB family protein [Arenibacter sp. GZD96]|uniref:DinB family protein n=1 Tax=Aurantibrevibacter litoralis TaxID=3106030 RepID=UPI002AFE778F|nr:DinB family protein [Arenibacter sp. GZD-96]MEA1785307.1 DinB family protein [Arenibacter sp. GZD-96]